jgi:hypothetical protein
MNLRTRSHQAGQYRKSRCNIEPHVQLRALPNGLPACRPVFVRTDPNVPEYLVHEWVLQFKNSRELLVFAAIPCGADGTVNTLRRLTPPGYASALAEAGLSPTALRKRSIY